MWYWAEISSVFSKSGLPFTESLCGLSAAPVHNKNTSFHYFFVLLKKWHYALCVTQVSQYTGCFRKNLPYLGRTFFRLNYIDMFKNTYIRNFTVTEIMAILFLKFKNCCTSIDCQKHIKTRRNL